LTQLEKQQRTVRLLQNDKFCQQNMHLNRALSVAADMCLFLQNHANAMA
jgi:hypothetical protein